MAGFFNKLKPGAATSNAANGSSPSKKKDEPSAELTPLEKMLQNAGPIREDGSDKFFGLENFGNTCYCNSIVQALFYSVSFRQNVVNYPPFSPPGTPNGRPNKVQVQIRPPMNGNATGADAKKSAAATPAHKPRQTVNLGGTGPAQPVRPEDKPDSPEYKKKQAMIKGPVLELAHEHASAYGMDESTFTGLKDIFSALIESQTRTGVLSPQRFLEIFRRDNEMFRNSMHQDAHEFYGLVLNDVISSVEATAKQIAQRKQAKSEEGLAKSVENALGASAAIIKAQSGTRSPGTGWVHDIFEGVLTSETRCLTCETASQRDETFLDLSIDLEEHSSVTSCLRKFSAEEMLCERNKFHCDHCGGLQEAEKRMKLKKLPKVLALHLKRFKYSEDFTKLEKLFHRVVYPYHLRMFNTTDDADDPDRLYELYAVVVHIGGNAYHGHYVSIIKTEERGWLLFDDEMVEPVDKHFVRNFFGDKPGTACAYVLFYQETTFEKVVAEQEAEGLEEVKLASQKADLALGHLQPNGVNSGGAALSKHITQPSSPIDDHEEFVSLDHAQTAPGTVPSPTAGGGIPPVPPIIHTHPLVAPPPATVPLEKAAKAAEAKQSKEEKEKEKKEAKAAEKARKAAEKEQAKLEEKQRKEREARQKAEAEEQRKAAAAASKLAAAASAAEEKEKKEASANANANANDTAAAATATPPKSPGFLSRSNRTSKSMTRKSFAFLTKDKEKDKDKDKEKEKSNGGGGEASKTPMEGPAQNGNGGGASHAVANHATTTADNSPAKPEKPEKQALKERFSFGLGRKKSTSLLQ